MNSEDTPYEATPEGSANRAEEIEATVERMKARNKESNYPASEVSHVEDEHKAEPEGNPLYAPGYQFAAWRLANGEWIMGQFAIRAPDGMEDLGESLFFNRIFSFSIAQGKDGKRQVRLAQWPASRGRIELDKIMAQAFVGVAGDVDLEKVYIESISTVKTAGAQDMQAAARQRQVAGMILDGVSGK